jgi:tetratricopeptide (TPR) repeat protein
MQWWRIAVVAGALAGCAGGPASREEAQKLLKTGYLLREQKDYGGAAKAFAAAVNKDASFGLAHMELGIEYLRFGLRLEDAVDEFALAAEADPKLWMATQYRVLAMLGLGNRKGALALQRELVERVPDKAEVHQNLGDLLLKESQWAEAERCFRKALELKAPYPLASGGLGTALWRGGKVDEGIEALGAAVEGLPQRADMRLELARALYARRRLDDAAAQAEAALKIDPEDGVVYHVLAEIRLAQGDRDAAAKLAQEAIARRCQLSAELKEKLAAKPASDAAQ